MPPPGERRPSLKAFSPDSEALGRAVREMRARRGLSQEALGFESDNMHRNYVGAVERGETNPTFALLMKLARGLDTPLSTLIGVYERHREQMSQAERIERAHAVAVPGRQVQRAYEPGGDETECTVPAETQPNALGSNRADKAPGESETAERARRQMAAPRPGRPALQARMEGRLSIGVSSGRAPTAAERSAMYGIEALALGRAIAEVRGYQGLSRPVVARRLGLPLAKEVAVERGEEDVRFELLTSFADALAVPISDLMLVYERYRERFALAST